MNNKKNSIEQIIQKFGGQSSLASSLGRRQSTVQHWANTGRIPSQWHQELLKLAREKGITLEPQDFVTQEVSVYVVVALEVIDVHHQQGHMSAEALGPVPLPGQSVLHLSPIGQLGQLVGDAVHRLVHD